MLKNYIKIKIIFTIVTILLNGMIIYYATKSINNNLENLNTLWLENAQILESINNHLEEMENVH